MILASQPGTVKLVNVGGTLTIVLLVDMQAAGQRELNNPGVRDNIRDTLRQRKEQVLRTAYLGAARNDAKVVNYGGAEAQGKLPDLGLANPGKK